MHVTHVNGYSRQTAPSPAPSVTTSIPQRVLDQALALQGSAIAWFVQKCTLLGELYLELPPEKSIEVDQVERDMFP